jgi:hypothetical protein
MEEGSIIPVVVTLYQESVIESNGTFVVPVFKLNSYIEEIRSGMCDDKEARARRIDEWQNQ